MLPGSERITYIEEVITPAQIRAARGLVDWTQVDLANFSGVSEMSIKNVERGKRDTRSSTLTKIQGAFREAGVLFLETDQASLGGGAGVRIKGE